MRVRLRRPTEGAVVFWLAFAVYLGVGAFLVFGANVIMGDALARVAIAQRILFSRDPHLGAIGFVWNPLPVIALLPLVPIKALWPNLVEQGFVGSICSALFMAGAVHQVRGFLTDIQINRLMRLTLTACFALHPMIVFYGANAMSEAPFLFFVLLGVRQLARWLRSGGLVPLVYAGIALACAYLTRYDAAAAGAVALLGVAIMSFARSDGSRRQRFFIGMCDALIVGAPFLVAFALWAVLSWLITGVAFEQISSVYGNAAQLRSLGVGPPTVANTFEWAVRGVKSILTLEPFLPVFMILTTISAIRYRDLRPVLVTGVLGAVLAFMLWAYATGTILRSLRYFIVAVPLGILLASLVVSPNPSQRPGRDLRNTVQPRDLLEPFQGRERPAEGSQARSRIAKPSLHGLTLASIVMLALALPAGFYGMLDPSVDLRGDAIQLQAALNRDRPTEDQIRASRRFLTEREIARYIDALHVPRGSVLVDDFLGFAIVLASHHPDQFIITSDRDFQIALADPAGSDIQYLLVPPPDAVLGGLDAINRTYSEIYESGAGISVLVRHFEDVSDHNYNWRLYRVAP